jgi:hypothetical protein
MKSANLTTIVVCRKKWHTTKINVMKLLALLICIPFAYCTQAIKDKNADDCLCSYSVLKTKVTLNEKNVPLLQILNAIEKQTSCYFDRDGNFTDSAGVFSFQCKNMPLNQCLSALMIYNSSIRFVLTPQICCQSYLIVFCVKSEYSYSSATGLLTSY